MKKIILPLFAVLALASCNNNDDGNSNGIQGTWKLTSLNNADGYDLNGDGVASANMVDEADCLGDSNIVFRSGGNATYYVQDLEINADIYGNGSFECNGLNAIDITYTVDGNNVILSFEGEEDIILTKSGNTISAGEDHLSITFSKQ